MRMDQLTGKLFRNWRKRALLLAFSCAQVAWLQTQSSVLETYDRGRSPQSSDMRRESRKSNDLDEKTKDFRTALFEDHEDAAWASLSAILLEAKKSILKVRWSSTGDAIASHVVPEWTKSVPGYVAKLQAEMEIHPASLAHEILQEAQDPYLHPEITFDPRVRIGKGLCNEEITFIQRRKQFVKTALARYLEVPESEIDPDDIPTIAICGSGGGLRALVAGASSCLSAQQSGLFDCAMYTAGVSGSCWLQSLYNSSLSGRRFETIIEHLKHRIGTHIAYPPAFFELVTRAPTNKYILSGTFEKLKGDPNATFGLVDIFGSLLAARLMIPRDELALDNCDLKLSNQQRFLGRGQNPMPIYSAVRHEIPFEEVKKGSNATDTTSESVTQEAKKKARFQWFEMTPYELGCEELEAAIPSWSIGCHYIGGRRRPSQNGFGMPEFRLPFLMGIWGSAFCATLAHYYKEVRPLFQELAGFRKLDGLIEGQKDELAKIHPVDPGQLPNYALGLEHLLPTSCPKSIFKDPYLNLMDAGMSNNLPIYPLLRKDREVDVIVCFDNSADIEQENWLSLVNGYAKQQGIVGWPAGAGWPNRGLGTPRADTETIVPDTAIIDDPALVADQVNEGQLGAYAQRNLPKHTDESNNSILGFCNIWVGNTASRIIEGKPQESRLLNSGEEWRLSESDSGITLVYLPFLPNAKAQGIDPTKSTFMSTWNFVYSPKEIDEVVALAKANFDEGEGQIRRAVKAVYRKKKARRLYLTKKHEIERSNTLIRSHGDLFS